MTSRRRTAHTNPHRISGTIGLPPCCPTCGKTTTPAGPFDTGTTCEPCARRHAVAQAELDRE